MAGHRRTPGTALGVILLSVLALSLGANAASSGSHGAPDLHDRTLTERGGCGTPSACRSSLGKDRTGFPPVPAAYDAGMALAWTELRSGPPLGTLGAGAGMISDGSTGVAVAFGGDGTSGLTNATASYSESADAWSTVATSNAPSPRDDFAFGFDPADGKAELFGGLVNLTSEAVSSDTWSYDVAHSTWSNVTHPGPRPREDPAFAIDPELGIGLLFGGQDPNYESVGTITFSDLWELNLTSYVWTEINVTAGPRPPPLEGASLTWDNSSDAFEMYGGCAPCSNLVWQFDPVTKQWTELAAPPNAPPAAAGAGWTYDPSLGADLLFGGTDGTSAFNATSVFYPSNDTWVPQTLPGPSARWNAASAYLNTTGNSTWLLAGGATPAGPTFDVWRLSATSSLGIRVENASAPNLPISVANVTLNGVLVGSTNSEGYLNLTQIDGVGTTLRVDELGYFSNTSTLWLPPGSSTERTIFLTVIPPRDLGTLHLTVLGPGSIAIVGGEVNLTINGTRVNARPVATGTTGEANFTRVPPGVFNLSVSATNWRSNSSSGTVAAGAVVNVTVELVPDPVLTVTVLGVLPSGLVDSLQGVTIYLNGGPFAVTPANGIVVAPTSAFGPSNVTGYALGYTSSTVPVTLPWTGAANVTLRLDSLPPGGIDAKVINRADDRPIDAAEVDADSSGPLPSGWNNVTYYTNLTGWVNFSVLEGFYEVSAVAFGFIASQPVLVHVLPLMNRTVTIGLSPNPGANISFLVRSAVNLAPIGGANVTISNYRSGSTDAAGFFNVTEIPAATYVVTASAPGFLANISIFTFTSYENGTFPINLTPLVPTQSATSRHPFQFLTSDSGALWALLLVPAVLAVGGFVYLAGTRIARSPEERRPSPVRPPSRPPEPPPDLVT